MLTQRTRPRSKPARCLQTRCRRLVPTLFFRGGENVTGQSLPAPKLARIVPVNSLSSQRESVKQGPMQLHFCTKCERGLDINGWKEKRCQVCHGRLPMPVYLQSLPQESSPSSMAAQVRNAKRHAWSKGRCNGSRAVRRIWLTRCLV